MSKTIKDLERLTGRGRRTVIKEINAGNMPGYRISGTNSYHIPDEAYELYAAGYWVPRSQRPDLVPTPVVFRRVTSDQATTSE